MARMKDYTEADRPAVLDLLKVHGPANVPTLARLRGVNATAVRQQLAALQREGLVVSSLERRKVGRPTHLYALTVKAAGGRNGADAEALRLHAGDRPGGEPHERRQAEGRGPLRGGDDAGGGRVGAGLVPHA